MDTIPKRAARDVPDFLIRTSLGCMLVVTLLLIPFTINNFIQHRYVMGLATTLVGIVCAVGTWHGFHGRYSLRLNTYVAVPLGALTIFYTLYRLGAAGSYWPFLLVVAYYFVLPARRAGWFNVFTFLLLMPLAWDVLDLPAFVRFSASLLAVILFAHFAMREIDILHGLLKEEVATDKLTGLFNRTLLEDSLQQAISQNRRAGVPMVVIIFDLDYFKLINDTLGHDVGDEVLIGMGDLLRKRIRGTDKVFRTGGEEFLVLVHNANEQQGAEVAENIRVEVERAALLPDRHVTISAGVCSLQEGMDVATWIKAADMNLYRAKAEGRNRVVV